MNLELRRSEVTLPITQTPWKQVYKNVLMGNCIRTNRDVWRRVRPQSGFHVQPLRYLPLIATGHALSRCYVTAMKHTQISLEASWRGHLWSMQIIPISHGMQNFFRSVSNVSNWWILESICRISNDSISVYLHLHTVKIPWYNPRLDESKSKAE